MTSDAQKKAELKYRQSVKGKAVAARHAQTEKGKATIRRHEQTEKGKATHVRYEQSERGKTTRAQYRQSESGKAVSTHAGIKHARTGKRKVTKARVYAKRKRNLGYNPHNNWFPNSNGHHIDKENVLFIPEELHISIRHKQSNPISMKAINDAAFEWLCTQEVL